jgi:hypothetical protein
VEAVHDLDRTVTDGVGSHADAPGETVERARGGGRRKDPLTGSLGEVPQQVAAVAVIEAAHRDGAAGAGELCGQLHVHKRVAVRRAVDDDLDGLVEAHVRRYRRPR